MSSYTDAATKRSQLGPGSTRKIMSDVGHSLLIVDDIAANRDVLARRFRSRGFRTVAAGGGHEALDLIEREKFDLVLLDVVMPDMNGLEVLAKIRERHSAAALPVVMATAMSESTDIVRALELGANDYVTKPVDFAVACARVETQLARKRAEDEASRAREELSRANEALGRANEELEQRVRARTAELTAVNEQLVGEIAQRNRSEAKIRFLAEHDALTGLANRGRLSEALARCIGRLRGADEIAAVFCLGLDHFKAVNDALGHAAGDELLVMVAKRLQAACRELDMIARLGGDKFAMVAASLKRPEDAGSVAERIIEALREPYEIGQQRVLIGASVGIAVAPGDGTDANRLLRSADLALCRAKSEGRGGFRFFEQEMDHRAQARRVLQLGLQSALDRNEFSLHYQPQIAIGTSKISGFEALLRWRHSELGMIPPTDFIPVAEELGLIVPIGEWALRRACAEAMRWPGDTRVAVNLSPGQFYGPDLPQTVASALEKSGLPAHRLELEITESVPLRQSKPVLAALHRIRDIGAHISLDDFGTGYSSLSYLQSFPFHRIKIDQSFVGRLSERRDCASIVRAVAGLGRSSRDGDDRGGGRDARTARSTPGHGMQRGPGIPVRRSDARVRNQVVARSVRSHELGCRFRGRTESGRPGGRGLMPTGGEHPAACRPCLPAGSTLERRGASRSQAVGPIRRLAPGSCLRAH